MFSSYFIHSVSSFVLLCMFGSIRVVIVKVSYLLKKESEFDLDDMVVFGNGSTMYIT